jgi:hypothetical protein
MAFEDATSAPSRTAVVLNDVTVRAFEVVYMWLRWDFQDLHLSDYIDAFRVIHGGVRKQEADGSEDSDMDLFNEAIDGLFDAYVFATTYNCLTLRQKIVYDLGMLYYAFGGRCAPDTPFLLRASKELPIDSMLTKFFMYCWAKHMDLDDLKPNEYRDMIALPQEFLVQMLTVAQRVSLVRGVWCQSEGDRGQFFEAIHPCHCHEHGEDAEEERKCREKFYAAWGAEGDDDE